MMDIKSLAGYLVCNRYPATVAAVLSNRAFWTLSRNGSFLLPCSSMLTWSFRLHRFLQYPGSKTRAIGKQEDYTQNFKEK